MQGNNGPAGPVKIAIITKVHKGETSRWVRIRVGEQPRDFSNKSENTILFKHQVFEHSMKKLNLKLT